MGVAYEPSREEREKLKEPLGRVLENKDEIREEVSGVKGQLILVGDYVSINFESSNPDVSVVDRRIQREEIEEPELEEIKGLCLRAENPAGAITQEAWDKVKEAIVREEKVKLRVKGEEDLLGIPAMLLAPPGSVVMYGLRGRGSVLVSIDESIKQRVRSFTDRRNFEKVIVGGSWSCLHPGHKYLLLTAFERGKEVLIGVTSNEMIEEKIQSDVEYEDYTERVDQLKGFLRDFGLIQRAEVRKIHDFKGDALEEGDAIVVSEETYDDALKINKIREGKGRKSLEIIKVSMLKNKNGEIISSSKIRRG